MRKWLAICLAYLCLNTTATFADSLADVRQDLAALLQELQGLQAELDTTQTAGALPQTSLLDKIAAIEFELKRLTRTTERLEFRIEQVVRDGTRRVGDLEFRVCELENSCIYENLGSTLPLGGVPKPVAPSVDPAPATTVTERGDFDRAQESFDKGDIETAKQMVAEFLATYPSGPLSQQAMMLMGASQQALGNYKEAVRAYLEAYSIDTTSDVAGDSLLQLAVSLTSLDQRDAACITYSEVIMKYPESDQAQAALSSRTDLACS